MSRNGQHSARVIIDAQVLPSLNGGVAHALLALVRALGALPDGEDEYQLVVGTEEGEAFWRPQLGRNQKLVAKAECYRRQVKKRRWTLRRVAASAMAPAKPLIRSLRHRLTVQPAWPEVRISDGFYERLGGDVLHFPAQRYILCSMPTVYNPHDLQHLHMPQFFPAKDLAWRETVYSTGCRFARTVIVGSNWAKEDIIRHYQLDPAKLQVIAEGPQLQLSPPIDPKVVQSVRDKYRLPETYLFYPAATWPHKNHIRLLEALALLREEHHLNVTLVCTGMQPGEFWPEIQKRIEQLGLQREARFLGFIPESDLRVIQRSAHALVQPSLFEASSLPIYDAWMDGVAVACSRVTALPEQVGNAGLFFDPMNPRDIADSILQLMTRPELHSELRERGFRRLKDFDWSRTARCYRAVYRRASNLPLSEEDQSLLEWDWMRDSKPQPNFSLQKS